jgi:hypothetical protein
MTQDTILNVWNEVRFTSDGISITLFSESQAGGAVVEDEAWFTFEELQEQAPSNTQSLNLSDETQSAISEQSEYSEVDTLLEEVEQNIVEDTQSEDLPEVGHIYKDTNAPEWSVDDRVEVVGISDKSVDEYVVKECRLRGGKVTVFDLNEGVDADETVIEAQYLDSDGHPSGKVYGFPVSRLE